MKAEIIKVKYPETINYGEPLEVEVDFRVTVGGEAYLAWSLLEPPDYVNYRLYSSTTAEEYAPGTYTVAIPPAVVPEDVPQGRNLLRVSLIQLPEGITLDEKRHWVDVAPVEVPPPPPAIPAWAIALGLGGIAVVGGVVYLLTRRR